MPFFRMNKKSKRGIQTFARASRLPPPIKDVELEYLNVRDWYMQTVGVKAQFEEALAQAKAVKNEDDIKLYGGKIKGLDGQLVDARQRVKTLGEKAFAEAFYIAATAMLPKEVHKALSIEAEALLGRNRHELK